MYSTRISERQRNSFNFHCTICFEAFHPELRPPVVLPCGHTYLCAPCSKRIKRCMECRTSLFLTPPSESICEKTSLSNSHAQAQTNSRVHAQARGRNRTTANSARGAFARSPTPKAGEKTIKEPIALPIPKNLLLISLMDMAGIEAKAKQNRSIKRKEFKLRPKGLPSPELLRLKTVASNSSDCSTEVILTDGNSNAKLTPIGALQSDQDVEYDISSSDDDFDFDFDDDNERVSTAIGVISSDCGTYAVADEDGLLVLPRKPADFEIGDCSYTSSLKRPTPPSPRSRISSPFKPINKSTIFKFGNEKSKKLSSLEKTYSDPPLPYEIKYRSKVQVVAIEDGWVTLARNAGYLYVDSKQLVKVGGPEDVACEVEGMLRALDETRKELNEKLETLNTIETNLLHKLEKAIQQPIPKFTPPKSYDENDFLIEEKTESKLLDALHLATPKSSRHLPPVQILSDDNDDAKVKTPNHDLTIPHLSTSATSTPDAANISPSRTLRYSPQSQGSPSIGRQRIRPNNSMPSPNNQNSRAGYMTTTSSPSNHSVNFRTGMSGHHGLLSNKSHPRVINRPAFRSMADHRGISGVGQTVSSWYSRRSVSSDSESRNTSTGTPLRDLNQNH